MNTKKYILLFSLFLALLTNPISAKVLHFAETLKTAGDLCYKEKEYLSALDFYQSAIKLAKQDRNRSLLAKILLKIGRSYQQLSQYPEALEYYFRYLDCPKEIVMELSKAKALENIASIYQDIGNYQLSYDFQLKALAKREFKNDQKGIARSLYQLGSLFFYQKNYQQALDYYYKAKDIWSKLGDQNSSLYCIGSLGAVYINLGQNNVALDYNLRALRMARELEMEQGEAYALHNIGTNYMELLLFEEAEEYLMDGLVLKTKIDDRWGQIGSYIYLGQLYIKKKEYRKAIQHLEKGMLLAEEIGSKTRKAELLRVMADAFHYVGDYNRSFAIFSSYTELQETLMNEKVAEEMGMRKTQYEVQKRESEIELLKREERINDLFYKVILIAGSTIVLLIISLLLFYVYKSQKKYSKTLAEKNEKIGQQFRELELANEDLKKFTYVASHDLKAPLRTLGSFAGLLKRRYDKSFDKDGREFLGFIIDGAKRMDQLLEDLLTYCQIESKEEKIVEIEAKNIINRALSNLRYDIGLSGGRVEINEEALPKVKGNPGHLTRLFQNIIGNGIKFHGDNNPYVHVDCKPEKEEYIFAVRDNGIGIEPEYQHKIFGMFSRLHNINDYEGTGIGLATCKKIIEKHSGRIWVESQPGQGSTFYFSLPR